jgi:hypothetical protein
MTAVSSDLSIELSFPMPDTDEVEFLSSSVLLSGVGGADLLDASANQRDDLAMTGNCGVVVPAQSPQKRRPPTADVVATATNGTPGLAAGTIGSGTANDDASQNRRVVPDQDTPDIPESDAKDSSFGNQS